MALLFIFSYPTKIKYTPIIERSESNRDRIFLDHSFKLDDGTTIPAKISISNNNITNDPRHSNRRKKGKIIFSNSVLLEKQKKDTNSTSPH